MARDVRSVINTGVYNNDFGGTLAPKLVTARIVKPAWMTDDTFTDFLTGFGYREIEDDEKSPCGPGKNQTYRKIIFETDKGSFSLPLNDYSPNLEFIQQRIDAIQTGEDAAKVICLRKRGERKRNVYNELRTSEASISPGTRAISSGPGSRYSGKYQYRDDYNIIRLVSFSIDTETSGSPPSILGDTWTRCAGSREDIQCAGTSNIEARHFVLTTVFSNSEIVPGIAASSDGDQKHKVPHATSAPGASVRACGVALSDLEAAVCLDYYGESDNSFHLTLGVTL